MGRGHFSPGEPDSAGTWNAYFSNRYRKLFCLHGCRNGMLTSKLVISNKNNKERGQLKSSERVITYGKIVIKLYCTSDRLRINKAVLWDIQILKARKICALLF